LTGIVYGEIVECLGAGAAINGLGRRAIEHNGAGALGERAAVVTPVAANSVSKAAGVEYRPRNRSRGEAYYSRRTAFRG
jgi:hypothetical protein